MKPSYDELLSGTAVNNLATAPNADPLLSATAQNAVMLKRNGGPFWRQETPVDTRNWGNKTADSVFKRFQGLPDLALGLGNALVGDNAAAADRLRRYQANEALATGLGPEAQEFGQIEGFGSAASVIGYQAAKMVPDLLLGGGAGLLGKQAVKLGAKKLLTGTTARELAGNAGIQSLKEGAAEKAVRETIKTSAYKELGNRAAERAAKKEARALAEGTFERQIQTTAGKLAAGNPAVNTAGNIGFAVGATAGSIPSNLQDQGQFLADNIDTMSQGDAWKLLAGTTVAASTDFLPLAGFMARFSKQGVEAAAAADRFGKRLLKATGKQFLAEGTQEATQAFITRASQKWVDENVEMLSQEALADYGMNFIAGGIMGGVMGAAGEVGTTTARKIGDAFKTTYTALEKRRIEREKARAAGLDPNAPPPEPSAASADPTASTDAAMSAATRSGRTINPVAAGAANAPGDGLADKISFSVRIDDEARGFQQQAEKYTAGDASAVLPVAVDTRRLTNDPFARIAGGVVLADTDLNAVAPEALSASLASLGKAFRYGFDSDLVTDGDRALIDDLSDFVANPSLVSKLLAMRSERPTQYAAAIAGIDAQIAASEDAELAAAERRGVNPADNGVMQTGRTTVRTEGVDGDAPNVLDETGEYFEGKNLKTAGQTARELTLANQADGTAAVFRDAKDGTPVRPSAVLLRPELQPAIQEFLRSLPPEGQAAAGKAYTDLMEAAQKVGELSKELPVFRQPAEEALAKIEQRADVQRLMQRVEQQATGQADRAASGKSLVFEKRAGAEEQFNSRIANKRPKSSDYTKEDVDAMRGNASLYAPSKDGTRAIDIGTAVSSIRYSDDMAYQATEKGRDNTAAVALAALLANKSLDVDATRIPWGQKLWLSDGTEIKLPWPKDVKRVMKNNAELVENVRAGIFNTPRRPYKESAWDVENERKQNEADGDELNTMGESSIMDEDVVQNNGLATDTGGLNDPLRKKALELRADFDKAVKMGWIAVQNQLDALGVPTATMIRRAPRDGKNLVDIYDSGKVIKTMTYERLTKQAPLLLSPDRPAAFMNGVDHTKFVKEFTFPTTKDFVAFAKNALLNKRVDAQRSERAQNVQRRAIERMSDDAALKVFDDIIVGEFTTMPRVSEARPDSSKKEADWKYDVVDAAPGSRGFTLPKGPYSDKDQRKASLANKFIGAGSAASSTARYAQAARDAGVPVNDSSYKPTDVVFVSVEGARDGRVSLNKDKVLQAVAGRATIVADEAQHRERSYNVGERELAELLTASGYTEKAGVWTPPAQKRQGKKATATTKSTRAKPWEPIKTARPKRAVEKVIKKTREQAELASYARLRETKNQYNAADKKRNTAAIDDAIEPTELADLRVQLKKRIAAAVARRKELRVAGESVAGINDFIRADIKAWRKTREAMDESGEKVVPRQKPTNLYQPQTKPTKPAQPGRDRALPSEPVKTRMTPRERAALRKAAPAIREVAVRAAPMRDKNTEQRMADRRERRKGRTFGNEVADKVLTAPRISKSVTGEKLGVAAGVQKEHRERRLQDVLGVETASAMIKTGLLDVLTRKQVADALETPLLNIDGTQAYAHDGNVVFIAEELDAMDNDELNSVLAHEAVHAWLPQLLGEKAYLDVVQRVFISSAKAFKEFAAANPTLTAHQEVRNAGGWKAIAFSRVLAVTPAKNTDAQQAADEVLAYHLSESSARRARENAVLTPMQRAARRAANLIKLKLLKVLDAVGAMKAARDALLDDPDFLAFVAEEAVFQMGLEAQRVAKLPKAERDAAIAAVRSTAGAVRQKIPWFTNEALRRVANTAKKSEFGAVALYYMHRFSPSKKAPADDDATRAERDALLKRIDEYYDAIIEQGATTLSSKSHTQNAKTAMSAPDKKLVDMNLQEFSAFTDKHLNPVQRQSLYDLVHSVGGFGKSIRDADSMTLSTESGYHKTMFVALSEYLAGNLKENPDAAQFTGAFDRLKDRMGVYTTNDLALKILGDMKTGRLEKTIADNLPYQPELELRTKATGLGSAVEELRKVGSFADKVYTSFIKNEYDQAKNSGIPAWYDLMNAIQPRSGLRVSIDPKTGKAYDGVTNAIAHTTGQWIKKLAKAGEGLTAEQETRVLRELYYNLAKPRPKKLNAVETEAFYKIRGVYEAMGAYGVAGGRFKGKEKGHNNLRKNYTPVIFDIGGNAELHKAKLRNMFYQLDANDNYKYHDLFDDLYEQLNPVKPGGKPETFGNATAEAKKRFVDKMVDNAFFDSTDLLLGNQMGKRFKFDAPRVWQQVYDLANSTGDFTDLDTLVSTLEPSLIEHGVRYVEPLVAKVEETRYFPNGVKPYVNKMVDQGASEEDVMKAVRAYENAFGRFTFATLGPNGEQGSPTIAALSEGLAKKLHSRKTLTVTQNIGAWQNLRLLPLAVLSSLVDPAGIIVRNGGNLTEGIQAFKTALAAIWSPETREALLAAASDIGYAAELEAAAALDANAGTGSRTPMARRINSWVFKWNGMQALTKYTRLVAIQAGHAFLVRQQLAARGSDVKARENALRYFEELGLKVDDVRTGEIKSGPLAGQPTVLLLTPSQLSSANKAQLEADARVKAAIIKFTDEAILRPSGLQTPGWHNDPYVKLITQYKAFTYAIYEQITRRIGTELHNGNYGVLNAALAYLPVIIMAELLREFIQYGPEGNPNRTDWGGTEYLGMATVRTGLLGPGTDFSTGLINDANRGNIPGKSFAGPTVGAASEIGKAATGERGWGDTITNLAPLSAVYKHWDDGASGRSSGEKGQKTTVLEYKAKISPEKDENG